LYRRHLASYFAAALMMPYARFLRACEATGYDIELLQRRFGAGFEQVAHRLTTLQRIGARGLPFFLVRIAAGTVSFWMFADDYDRELKALDHLPVGARLVTFIGTEC
ncbi:ImmA/IrrE family metallo-endopeptidase, partial [Escherichia coli]|uniref:ImmA/IrrE family metallo-endopeptidase n=1 Tax=Escherichia coli TaxID=562 RepID=UPI00191551A4